MNWLGNLDSNQDKQSQSLLCYRYTIPQLSNKFNGLLSCPTVASEATVQIADRAVTPFYPLGAGLGKRGREADLGPRAGVRNSGAEGRSGLVQA